MKSKSTSLINDNHNDDEDEYREGQRPYQGSPSERIMSRDRSTDEGREDLESEAPAEEMEAEVAVEDSPMGETVDEEDAEGSVANDPQAELLKRLEEAIGQASGNRDRYLRAVAELENYRKRTLREKEELRKFGAAAFVEDLLPVIDSLKMGLESVATNPETEAVIAGFTLACNQLREVLKENGIAAIEPQGAPFDPNLHEAVAHHASEEVAEGHVIAVIRIGYTLHDRLIRAASVVVSSGEASEGESE